MHFTPRDLRILAKEVGLSLEKRAEIIRILKEDGELS
jgi:DNA-binding Lrp family transcriptional regulator